MSATDTFVNKSTTDFPATEAAAVVPHNTNELSYVTRGLYVGTGGDVKVTMRGGQAVTFPNVQAGTLLPFRVKIVWATGTSASDIVAVW